MIEYDSPLKGQTHMRSVREQIQEDILTYMAGRVIMGAPRHSPKYEQIKDDLCQIVVDNFKTLEK